MRTRILALSIVTVVVISTLAGVLILVKKEAPVEILQMEMAQEENLHVLENGDATIRTSFDIPDSPLADVYRSAFEEIPSEEVYEAIREERKTLFGQEIEIIGFENIPVGLENEFSFSIDAQASQLARYDADTDTWRIDLGPQEENDRAAAIGFMMTQMMFTQLMLDSLPEEQQFEHTTSTPIRLPEGAVVLNADELSGLEWRVDFGGGNYREAHISLDENMHTVVLTEKIVVTEQPPTVSPEEFLEDLYNYRVVTIEYSLGAGHMGASLESGSDQLAGAKSLRTSGSGNWSKTWPKSGTANISYNFSKDFSWSGTYGGASASANLNISASPSLDLRLYLGWEFSWFRLQWFRTYWEVTPSATVNFEANVTGGVEKSWSHTFDAYTHEFWFAVGTPPIPVRIDLDLDVIPGVDVEANATCTVSAGVGASVTGRFGVEWTKEDGWKGIKELDYDFERIGPTITGSADITITPYVKLKLEFYLYGVAGPYVYFKPKAQLEASYPEGSWSIGAGFDINAGVGMGKLGRWTGLEDWEPDPPLYSWLTTVWEGEWEVPPSPQPSPVITSSLRIVQPPPYNVGDTITAEFEIANKGTGSITFDVLTVGGRDSDNQVADFTWRRNITIEGTTDPSTYFAGYSYRENLTLAKADNYHFFCAYRTPDGNWNTSIPTESGVTNVLYLLETGRITFTRPAEWSNIVGLSVTPGSTFARIEFDTRDTANSELWVRKTSGEWQQISAWLKNISTEHHEWEFGPLEPDTNYEYHLVVEGIGFYWEGEEERSGSFRTETMEDKIVNLHVTSGEYNIYEGGFTIEFEFDTPMPTRCEVQLGGGFEIIEEGGIYEISSFSWMWKETEKAPSTHHKIEVLWPIPYVTYAFRIMECQPSTWDPWMEQSRQAIYFGILQAPGL